MDDDILRNFNVNEYIMDDHWKVDNIDSMSSKIEKGRIDELDDEI